MAVLFQESHSLMLGGFPCRTDFMDINKIKFALEKLYSILQTDLSFP